MDSRAKKCLLCLTLLAALCGSLPAAPAQPVASAAPAARTGRIERVTIADERGDHGLPSPFTHAPDGVGYALTMLVFDSLLWRDRQGHLVPALARQWRESEDRLAVEFDLHPQARWHDGQPVTAGDVAFTFDYFRQHPNPFMDVSAVAGVDALAGGRVRVRLKRPSASFVPQLAATLPILPRHVFAPLADPRRMSMQGVVGSGPYRVTGYDKAGGRYRFSAVEGHWQGAPRVRELVFVRMEPSLALGALRRGEVDMIRALPTHLLDEAGRFATVVKAQSGHPARLRFNHARAPFADKRLRQPHIDRAAQSARAIQHRSRAFHHFHAIGQPQRHERGHGPRRLRGVEPHAIDQQHHAVALEAANHRIHALRAIQRNGQPRLAAHGLAHIARLLARQVFAREHRGGNGRFGGIGRVALGRDGDSGQAGLIRRIRRAVFLRVRCALRVNMRGQQGGCGQGNTGRAVHLGRTPHHPGA